MNKTDKPLTGFTLIEILTYIAVLSIIMVSTCGFLIWTSRANIKIKATREVSDNLNRLMEQMTYEIKEAKGLYTPTFSNQQLSLETTHYLPTGEEISYLDFFLCGPTTLCIKKETSAPLALNSERVEVNYLSFKQIGSSPPSVQVSLELNFKNPQNKPEYQAFLSATSTISLRSY